MLHWWFTVVSAAAPSAATPPCGDVGDYGKEPGNLSVVRHKGGREARVGDYNPLNGAIILDRGVCEVVEGYDHCVAHIHLRRLVRHSIVGNASEPNEITFF